jgi:hypothetical protein
VFARAPFIKEIHSGGFDEDVQPGS